jgi:hypothetical protein
MMMFIFDQWFPVPYLNLLRFRGIMIKDISINDGPSGLRQIDIVCLISHHRSKTSGGTNFAAVVCDEIIGGCFNVGLSRFSTDSS